MESHERIEDLENQVRELKGLVQRLLADRTGDSLAPHAADDFFRGDGDAPAHEVVVGRVAGGLRE